MQLCIRVGLSLPNFEHRIVFLQQLLFMKSADSGLIDFKQAVHASNVNKATTPKAKAKA